MWQVDANSVVELTKLPEIDTKQSYSDNIPEASIQEVRFCPSPDETGAWWMVDLKKEYVINEVEVINNNNNGGVESFEKSILVKFEFHIP